MVTPIRASDVSPKKTVMMSPAAVDPGGAVIVASTRYSTPYAVVTGSSPGSSVMVTEKSVPKLLFGSKDQLTCSENGVAALVQVET